MAHRIKQSIKAKHLTIDELFAGFISEKIIQGKSRSTTANYTKSYLKWMKDMGYDETTSIDVITKNQITLWTAALQHQGIKTASINHYLRDIRAFIYWTQDEEYTDEKFPISLMKEQETAPKCLTDDDIERLLVRPLTTNYAEYRMWVIVNTVLATGFRKGTICDLTMKDIDMTNRMIVASHTKSKKYLKVPISNALAPILRDFINAWRADAEPDDYVFCSITGGRMSENACRLAYERYCEMRGVEDTAIHHLRHSFAKHAVLAGVNPFTLQSILGHSQITMSAHYVSVFGEDIKEGYSQYSMIDDKNRQNKRIKRNGR